MLCSENIRYQVFDVRWVLVEERLGHGNACDTAIGLVGRQRGQRQGAVQGKIHIVDVRAGLVDDGGDELTPGIEGIQWRGYEGYGANHRELCIAHGCTEDAHHGSKKAQVHGRSFL